MPIFLATVLFLFCGVMHGQTPSASLPALPDFVHPSSPVGKIPLRISQETVPSKPVSVVGPYGAILGDQSGRYEAWIFPWKILSGMHITARMEDYPVPIDVNEHSAWIDVEPDHTTITYSHANFTIRQIMVAPKKTPTGSGVLVLYQIQAIRPMTLTFSFDPVMQRMWPAESDDRPSPEWVPGRDGSGFYILHENFPDHAAALAMPRSQPGILAPYQEGPHEWPLQFVLHFDPAKDSKTLFPLLITLSNTAASSTKAAFAASLSQLDDTATSIYQENAAYYRNFLAQRTSIETPDQHLNAAFSWAEVAMDQLRVRTTPGYSEQAFTAGFVASGDAARPGFGWFFGRDALWSLYAVNSYGDYVATQQEIEFLLRRQRANGEIMHEYSQTADLVDWKSLPYEYASADATPLLQMAMNDYLNVSGDVGFVRSHWKQLQEAWNFETTHDSADGIYNNNSGSGWVESWVPSMPHQEIYLAALDEQASMAFANLARSVGETALAGSASARADRIQETIEKEYFLPASGFYAFSHNANGSTDDTPTIFPSVAWWDGDYGLGHTGTMLSRWASSEFSTDWGLRILSDQVKFYDPISYHQGSVWPLFTGWVSVAEYRTGHPLSAYAHLMQNADLTWSQDLGSVTELLSGEFYQVLGRSTAHQLWSSAMVISPILRGMFGLRWDAIHRTLQVTPHLPADWNSATLRHLPFGNGTLDLNFVRQGRELKVTIAASTAGEVHLESAAAGAKLEGSVLHIPLPAVEAVIEEKLPCFGEETRQMKVLDEEQSPHSLLLTLSAPALSRQALLLRENEPGLRLQIQNASGTASQEANGLRRITIDFPPGTGYVTKTVKLSW